MLREAIVSCTRQSRLDMFEALFEREAELESLTGTVEAAWGGSGGYACVEGPPGIGKSSLLTAASRLGRERGMQMLAARGVSWSARSRSVLCVSCSSRLSWGSTMRRGSGLSMRRLRLPRRPSALSCQSVGGCGFRILRLPRCMASIG